MAESTLWQQFEDMMKTHACNCIGPQNGDPVCPCRMRGVQQRNGRYVEVHDLGPVRNDYFRPDQVVTCDSCGCWVSGKFCSNCGAKL